MEGSEHLRRHRRAPLTRLIIRGVFGSHPLIMRNFTARKGANWLLIRRSAVSMLFFVRLLPHPQPQQMRGAAPTAAVSAVRNAMDARYPPERRAPSIAIAAHTAMAMSSGLASMVKPALVGRRHADVSRHPQESVSVVNVGAGEDRRGLEAFDDEVDAE